MTLSRPGSPANWGQLPGCPARASGPSVTGISCWGWSWTWAWAGVGMIAVEEGNPTARPLTVAAGEEGVKGACVSGGQPSPAQMGGLPSPRLFIGPMLPPLLPPPGPSPHRSHTDVPGGQPDATRPCWAACCGSPGPSEKSSDSILAFDILLDAFSLISHPSSACMDQQPGMPPPIPHGPPFSQFCQT